MGYTLVANSCRFGCPEWRPGLHLEKGNYAHALLIWAGSGQHKPGYGRHSCTLMRGLLAPVELCSAFVSVVKTQGPEGRATGDRAKLRFFSWLRVSVILQYPSAPLSSRLNSTVCSQVCA